MDRRLFIKAGVSAAAFVSFAGMTAGFSRRAEAATAEFNLLASPVDYQLSGLNPPVTIPMWQWVDITNPGPPLSTVLRVLAGDTVVINVTNALAVDINLVIPGLIDNAPPCAPGANITYTFTAPTTPGSYVFRDGQNGYVGSAMGLAGGLVVMPADGSMNLQGGVAYNRDHTLILGEVDSRLNAAIATGGSYNIQNYEPNFFFVNGRVYIRDVSKVELQMAMGENVAFRLINTGLIYYPMHFHGYHVSVITRGAAPEPLVRDKDTVMVQPGETVEAILNVNQPGLYPLHTHYLPGVTNNGVYAGGGLIIMNAA
ncbi:MAG: multicopper oxidase domain-containing protein [Gammaproteobacteria bacterium]|nr:multicopper oxidase domain-containing protein [Gammaproteobacteria bacterium]